MRMDEFGKNVTARKAGRSEELEAKRPETRDQITLIGVNYNRKSHLIKAAPGI